MSLYEKEIDIIRDFILAVRKHSVARLWRVVAGAIEFYEGCDPDHALYFAELAYDTFGMTDITTEPPAGTPTMPFVQEPFIQDPCTTPGLKDGTRLTYTTDTTSEEK